MNYQIPTNTASEWFSNQKSYLPGWIFSDLLTWETAHQKLEKWENWVSDSAIFIIVCAALSEVSNLSEAASSPLSGDNNIYTNSFIMFVVWGWGGLGVNYFKVKWYNMYKAPYIDNKPWTSNIHTYPQCLGMFIPHSCFGLFFVCFSAEGTPLLQPPAPSCPSHLSLQPWADWSGGKTEDGLVLLPWGSPRNSAVRETCLSEWVRLISTGFQDPSFCVHTFVSNSFLCNAGDAVTPFCLTL